LKSCDYCTVGLFALTAIVIEVLFDVFTVNPSFFDASWGVGDILFSSLILPPTPGVTFGRFWAEAV